MENKLPRVFIDTNVWFSALYGSSICETVIKAQMSRKVAGIISERVLSELIKNTKKKIPYSLDRLQSLLLASPPVLVPDSKTVHKLSVKYIDIKDRKIFSSAIVAKVDYFVTGNIKDFKVKQLEKSTGIKILTPKQLVERLNLK